MTDIASIVDAIKYRSLAKPIHTFGGLGILLALLALPIVAGSENTFYISFGIGLLVFISLAISFNLIAGYAGQFSLGHILFYGIGGYAAMVSVEFYGIHWLPALGVAMVVGVVVAAIVGAITLRLRNIYFATGTLAVAEFTRIWMTNWEEVGGSSGISAPQDVVSIPLSQWYYVVLAIALGSFLLSLVFDRTILGSRLEAIRDNEPKAQAVGINTWVAKNLAFVISAIPAAAAGAVHVFSLKAINPGNAFEPMMSIQMQLMVILGGLGTVLGPIVGGGLFYSLREFSVLYSSSFHLLITGPAVIVVILFAPQGIVGWLRDRF